MQSLTAVSKSKSIIFQPLSIFAVLVVLLLAGCSGELPNDVETGDDLTLAAKIDREASFRRVNSLANIAVWDSNTGLIAINGFDDDDNQILISNAATGQLFNIAAISDDDDDNRSLIFPVNNIAAVPCSIRVQVSDYDDDDRRPAFQVIPVQNAPANCVGIAATPAGTGFHIDRARWKNSTNRLKVKGSGAIPRELVSVFDGITGQLLGTDQADAIGRWSIKARNLIVAPCTVTAVSSTMTVQAAVSNAPLNCGVNPIFNNPIGGIGFNQAPDGVIIGPISDMSVNVGSSINFMATGFDPDSNGPLAYRWTVDGMNVPNAIQQNTTIFFNQAGVYVVSLYVTDSTGLVDPTPDTRVIVVQPNLLNNQAPTGQIISPTTNVEINAGQSVFFSGTGFDPDFPGTFNPVNPLNPNTSNGLQYIWNFSGGAPNSTLQTPGNVIFSTPGVYLVSLTVIDSTGMADPTPEVIAVTVRGGATGFPGIPGTFPGFPNNNPTNIAPDGEIIDPASNLNLATGQSYSFRATAFDPDNSGQLRYRWDFGTLAPASNQLNPPPVRFNTPGVYIVSFTVTDAAGAVDPTPSVRTIIVGGTGNNQPPNSLITFPTNNQTISTGQSLTFSGTGFDPDNNAPLTYRWDFGGAASASNQQNPGAVVFNQPGTYIVSLTVTDSLGVSDLTPDTRVITVVGTSTPNPNVPGANFVNQAPESQITAPANDLIVNVGDSIDFNAIGTDPENDSPLIYSWDFDGAAPDMLVQNPGHVSFNQAGSYRIRLTVIDANGNADKTPAERIITVRSALGGPIIAEPNGTITSPATSISVNVGEPVSFSAQELSGNSFVTYEWDFSGAAPASSLQNPGLIQFNEPGIVKVTLYTKNNLGYYDSTPDVRFITVQGTPNANQAPEAKIISPATDLVIDAGNSVSFIGSGQDLDNFGANLTYMWNFGGGSTTLPSSSLAAPGPITFNFPGIYTVSLTVMDNFGQSDMTPETRVITVRDTAGFNNAPTVTIINPSQFQSAISIGQSLSFSALASDVDPQDNIGLKYEWNFDGAASDSNLQNPGSITFDRAGTFNVSVVAEDARGKRSIPDTVTVSVQGGGFVSPVAPDSTIITPTNAMTITVGDTVNFRGRGTDSDSNFPLLYRWNFDGAAPSSFSAVPGNVTFNKVGTYRVQFTVSDSTGATDLTPAIRVITVTAQGGSFGNQPAPTPGTGFGFSPTVTITSPNDLNGITTIPVGGSVNFQSTAQDPDGNIPLSYRWTFGNGLPDQFVQNPGNVTFFQAGTHFVTLTVTDTQGNSGTDIVQVIVGGNSVGNTFPGLGINAGAPNGIINAPASQVTISRNGTVYFAGDAIDPDGDFNVSYSWDFGGGAVNSTLKIPGNVTFSNAGTYDVRLTVTDSTGLSDQTPATVRVTVLQ